MSNLSLTGLHKISQLTTIPSFVKEGSFNDEAELKKLPPTSFADPTNRVYPIHTKSAAWLSHAYFTMDKQTNNYSTKKAAIMQEILTKAAEIWGIERECKVLTEALTKKATTLSDLPDDQFALVLESDKGQQRFLPLFDSNSVKAASLNLYEYRHTLPYVQRQIAAKNIVKAAEKFNVDVSDNDSYIDKAAGYGIGVPTSIMEALAARVTLIGDSNSQLRIKVAELAESMMSQKPTMELSEKLATMIAATDEAAGIYRDYKNGLATPEEICFAITEKSASEALSSNVTLQTGKTYPIAELTRIPMDKIATLFGDDMVKEISNDGITMDAKKASQCLPTLPRDDAVLIERLMGK